ncbi:hypothetical protein SUGI_0918860 [Cryptomeria japonica]|nr:hypothetical protein SUGI_0918860 [Cryptomeria japonica]
MGLIKSGPLKLRCSVDRFHKLAETANVIASMTEIVHERFRLSRWLCSCTWALAMDRGVNMVTINVGLVVGPGFAYKTSGPTITYLIDCSARECDGFNPPRVCPQEVLYFLIRMCNVQLIRRPHRGFPGDLDVTAFYTLI